MTVTDTSTVEERLAAIEAAIAPPLTIGFPEHWTDEQVTGFRQAWDEQKYRPIRVPPSRSLLTPDLARECITVIKPGEVLVLRCPEEWTAHQAQQMQEYTDRWLEGNAPGVKVLTVPHVEMAVIEST